MPASKGSSGGAGRDGWTPGRSFVFLLLLLDVTVVAVWLFIYSAEYDRVQKVVGGIWVAVTTFLAAVGWKSKETSLSAFVGLLPVRLVAIAYTLLIAGALPLWVAYQFPIHRVDVTSTGVDASARWVVVVTRGTDTAHVHRGGGTWTFMARPGSHTLEARADGYRPFDESLNVRWLGLSDRVDLQGLAVEAGMLRLRFNRDMSWEVTDSTGGTTVRTGMATSPGPLLVELAPGRYMVRAQAPGTPPDSATIQVSAGDTADAVVDLRETRRMGRLTVRSDPAGMEVFIDGEQVGTTPWSGRQDAGRYVVTLRRRSPADPQYGQYARGQVRVEVSGETIHEPPIETIRLPALRIFSDGGATATYYLDRAEPGSVLGEVAGSHVFHVFPGDYAVLRRAGGAVTECGRFSLRPEQEVVVRC
jgi:hypothetical protein